MTVYCTLRQQSQRKYLNRNSTGIWHFSMSIFIRGFMYAFRNNQKMRWIKVVDKGDDLDQTLGKIPKLF